MFRHVIFDLDGTLMDTILDISHAINIAMEKTGFPYRYDRDSTRYLIGDGADALIHRSLQKDDDLRNLSLLKPIYMKEYHDHQLDSTKPFTGVKETLLELREAGVRLSVVTNKPDSLTQVLLPLHFGEDLFDFIRGIREGDPVKPDPISVNMALDQVGVPKEECLYVGDSHVDVLTGHNAFLPVAFCLWGYEVDPESTTEKAEFVLKVPADLKKVVL